MNILVLNTHSVLNSGDAAIVLGLVGLLRGQFREPRIAVTSRTPVADREFYRHLDIDVLPPLFVAPSAFDSRRRKLAGCTRSLLSLRSKRDIVREIRRADLVISSGGGYFFSARRHLPGPVFWQAFLQVRLAQRLGRPIVFAPQSFGPLASCLASRMLRSLLSHRGVRRVLVREESSLELVRGLLRDAPDAARVSLCPDLAFLLNGEERDGGARHGSSLPAPVLAVTARDWLFPERRGEGDRRAARRAYLQALRDVCLDFHRRRNGSILIFAQSRGPGRLEDDRAISAELGAALGGAIPASYLAQVDLPEDAPPAQLLATISRADLLLASRFHSAILAMIAGKPAIALGYQPKSLGMMKMLGLERFCLPMDGFQPAHVLPLIDELLAGRERFVAQRVRPAVAAMRSEIAARARETFAPFLPA